MFNILTYFFTFVLFAIVNALAPNGTYSILSVISIAKGQQLALSLGGINTPLTLQPWTPYAPALN